MEITEERFVKALELAMKYDYHLDQSKSLKETLTEMEQISHGQNRPENGELENKNSTENRFLNAIKETNQAFSFMLDDIDTVGVMLSFLEHEAAENKATERLKVLYGYYR